MSLVLCPLGTPELYHQGSVSQVTDIHCHQINLMENSLTNKKVAPGRCRHNIQEALHNFVTAFFFFYFGYNPHSTIKIQITGEKMHTKTLCLFYKGSIKPHIYT